jgi:hypothetical protein
VLNLLTFTKREVGVKFGEFKKVRHEFRRRWLNRLKKKLINKDEAILTV